jgi:hypothetical protein
VVALIVVLHCGEPVTSLIGGMLMGKGAHLYFRAEVEYGLAYTRVTTIHVQAVIVQVDEHKSKVFFQANLWHTDIRDIKTRHCPGIGRTHQLPLQIIGPGVVWAGHPAPVPRSFYQFMSAMLAHVVESTQFFVPAPDYKNILVKNGKAEIVPAPGHLAAMAAKLPGFVIDMVPDPVENLRVDEIFCR